MPTITVMEALRRKMKHLSGCESGDFGSCTCDTIRMNRAAKVERAVTIKQFSRALAAIDANTSDFDQMAKEILLRYEVFSK